MKIKLAMLGMLFTISIYSCNTSNEKMESTTTPTSMVKDDNSKAVALFQTNCASCHNPIKDAIGPALQGALSRVPSREWLQQWIRNSSQLISNKDAYAVAIHEKWNKSPMTAFPNLSDEEINLLIDEYCK